MNPTSATRDTLVTYLKDHNLYEGESRAPIGRLRELAAEHQAQVRADQLAAAEAVETPTVMTAEQRAARLEAATAESKNLKQWERDGATGTRPPTPNLDQLNAQSTKGITVKTKTSSTTKQTKEETPKPQPGAGHTIIKLKTDRQGEIVATAVKGAGGVKVTGPWVTVENAKAQKVFDTVVRNSQGAAIFDRRVLDFFGACLLLDRKTVKDERTSVHAKLIAAGRDGLKDGSVKSFGFVMKLDGTLEVEVVTAKGKKESFPTQKTALAWFAPAVAA